LSIIQNTLEEEMLSIGSLAPDFEVLTDTGVLLRLSSLRGQTVVLFFYPKADTTG
jgi:thioredoxin-dependent peroxiredoxin